MVRYSGNLENSLEGDAFIIMPINFVLFLHNQDLLSKRHIEDTNSLTVPDMKYV